MRNGLQDLMLKPGQAIDRITWSVRYSLPFTRQRFEEGFRFLEIPFFQIDYTNNRWLDHVQD